MKTRWLGITGLLLLLTAMTLNVVGPRFFPRSYWGNAQATMMGGGMMNGMMNGGMMNGGMMGSTITADPNRPFDQQFLDQMIIHHQQAVMMAQHMIADSDRAELRDLAQRIITAQQGEIDQMRQWRSGWYGTAEAGTPQEAMMAQMQSSAMNRAQMRQMMGGNVDLDRMFLQMMIPHHEDAITMAQQALEQAEHAEVKTLAQTIVSTQQAEIEEMQRYLNDWYGVAN
jgi:uncharacterized protein (DUF305 family)